jgi:hypothetical protein
MRYRDVLGAALGALYVGLSRLARRGLLVDGGEVVVGGFAGGAAEEEGEG